MIVTTLLHSDIGKEKRFHNTNMTIYLLVCYLCAFKTKQKIPIYIKVIIFKLSLRFLKKGVKQIWNKL